MEKLTNAVQLKSMIRLLEQNVSRQEEVIKVDAQSILENLKPVKHAKQKLSLTTLSLSFKSFML